MKIDVSFFSSLCLFATALFSFLVYVTPRDSAYETVEGDMVFTRMVFIILAVVSFVAWLAIQAGIYS